MTSRDHRAPVWVIWGLVAVFGGVQAIAWTVAGAIPRRPGVVAQVVTAWIVMLILASLATRRLGWMAQRIRAQDVTHRETMTEIEQLQTQNAMLEIIARSVDVTLAFQALASRIETMQGFHLLMNLALFPLLFFSGAFFPLDGLPAWLEVLAYVNPLTYAVDALQLAAYASTDATYIGLGIDFTVLSLLAVGAYALSLSRTPRLTWSGR